MTEEKKLDPAGEKVMNWECLPPTFKTIVYEHLREISAKMRKDGAVGTVVQGVIKGRLGKDDPGTFDIAHQLIAEAFDMAIEELMIADPDICAECGGYHNSEEPAKHPKDLS